MNLGKLLQALQKTIKCTSNLLSPKCSSGSLISSCGLKNDFSIFLPRRVLQLRLLFPLRKLAVKTLKIPCRQPTVFGFAICSVGLSKTTGGLSKAPCRSPKVSDSNLGTSTNYTIIMSRPAHDNDLKNFFSPAWLLSKLIRFLTSIPSSFSKNLFVPCVALLTLPLPRSTQPLLPSRLPSQTNKCSNYKQISHIVSSIGG